MIDKKDNRYWSIYYQRNCSSDYIQMPGFKDGDGVVIAVIVDNPTDNMIAVPIDLVNYDVKTVSDYIIRSVDNRFGDGFCKDTFFDVAIVDVLINKTRLVNNFTRDKKPWLA